MMVASFGPAIQPPPPPSEAPAAARAVQPAPPQDPKELLRPPGGPPGRLGLRVPARAGPPARPLAERPMSRDSPSSSPAAALPGPPRRSSLRGAVDRVLLADDSADRAFRIGEALPPAAGPLLRDLGVLDRFLADGHLPCYGNVSSWGSDELDRRPTSSSTRTATAGTSTGPGSMPCYEERRDAGAKVMSGTRLLGATRLGDGSWKASVNVRKDDAGSFAATGSSTRPVAARPRPGRWECPGFLLDRLVAFHARFEGPGRMRRPRFPNAHRGRPGRLVVLGARARRHSDRGLPDRFRPRRPAASAFCRGIPGTAGREPSSSVPCSPSTDMPSPTGPAPPTRAHPAWTDSPARDGWPWATRPSRSTRSHRRES